MTGRTELEATVQRFEHVFDQMGRAFAADLALAELERRSFAELERRLDALEQAEPVIHEQDLLIGTRVPLLIRSGT